MKAYNNNNEIVFQPDGNDMELPLIVQREFSNDEIKFGKINETGDEIEIDQVKKTEYLDNLKIQQKGKIKQSMYDERSDSAVIEIDINGLKTINAREQSLVDSRTLHNYMVRNNIDNVDYRDSENNMFAVTQSDVDNIRIAIEDNGFSLYQKKWLLEAQIDNVSTEGNIAEEEIRSILW